MYRRATVFLVAAALAVTMLVPVRMSLAQEADPLPADPTTNTYAFSDSWTGADAAKWNEAKWTTDGGTSVQSEQGRMRFENVSGARARAIALMPRRVNTEILMSFQFPATGPKGLLQLFSRSSANWAPGYPESGYFIEIANDSTSIGLRKVTSGTLTQLRNAAVGQTTTAKQWLRFRVRESTIQAKVWTDGTEEPSEWEIEATDTSFKEPGVLQLRWARASAATDAREVYLDDVTVRDLDASELPSDPSKLAATAASTSKVDLSWTDEATNESSYAVERSVDGSTAWTDVTSTLPPDTTRYSDTNLDSDTRYYYRVKAINAGGASGYSNIASTTTHALPPAAPIPNATPDETWMTNGTVYSIIRHGDYIYVGGQFTRARSSPSGQSFLATNVARFDAETGVGDPTWTPDVTGTDMTTTQVYALGAAGGQIWVGGKFESVDGLARRNLAAVSPDTGKVDPSVDPLIGTPTSGAVRALVVSGTKVYVGGNFTAIDGQGRSNLAALDLSGSLDTTWKPRTDSPVRSLAFSCDGDTVFAGGLFRNAAGPDGLYSPRQTLSRFDATTGSLDPWSIPVGTVPNEEAAIDLAVTCERVTAAYQGRNIVRSFRLDSGATGTMAWADKCGGDPQAVTMLGPDKLVIGGHFSQVLRAKRSRIALINLSDGSVDSSWSPAVEGHWMGPWDLLVDENHLYVGGRFDTVAGLARWNFARFTLT